MSRLKSRQADDIPIDMPPNPDPQLTEWLLDVGPSLSGSMGERPIEWADIAAWRAEAQIDDIEPWDKRMLISMSRAWCSQRADAERPNCTEPMLDEADAADAAGDRINREIASIFGSFATDQDKEADDG